MTTTIATTRKDNYVYEDCISRNSSSELLRIRWLSYTHTNCGRVPILNLLNVSMLMLHRTATQPSHCFVPVLFLARLPQALCNWNRVCKTGLSHDVNTSLYTDRMPINICHVIVVTLIYGCSLSATTVIGDKNRRRRYAIGATGSSLQY